MAETQFKNFKSPDGSLKYIASTLGWILRIEGPEWTSVPDYAWEDCYAYGCISEDQFKNMALGQADLTVVDTLTKVADRESRIMNQMRTWVDSNDRPMFDKSGNPRALELRRALSITVTRDERDRCWRKLQEEMSE